MKKKTIQITSKYLYLPIQKGQPEKRLEIFDTQGEKCFEFLIPMGEDAAEYPYDYMAELFVESFVGKKLVMQGDFSLGFWDKVVCTEADIYEAKNRPTIHFTPKYGWMNDPNGLVYADGVYHMYFQYNPFNIVWNNMSWGHAVSKDLLHWQQLDTVMYPDEQGTMFSGCGLINERGCLKLPEDALLFFYTAAGGTNEWSKGKEFTQRIAYSVDGGQTLQKLEMPYIETSCKENRDPKVFWHEESQAYICALWLEENDFAILRSMDLSSWELSDRFELPGAWECPDLLKITGENGEEKWLYWSADGYYFWGEFDGYHFCSDGKRYEAYINKMAYAAQTYSNVSGRVISVPWLRQKNAGRDYTGVMGLPREFTFRYEGEECLLVQKPVRELKESSRLLWETNTKEIIVELERADAYMLEFALGNQTGCVEVQGAGFYLTYEQNTGELCFNEEGFAVGAGRQSISLLLDVNILEVSLDGGVKLGMFEVADMGKNSQLCIRTSQPISLEMYAVEYF
ncbi:MAG: glycoside hydrolase family 32 protein [Lachnospiraceae bacterium]|nr:glycoside hydrolase family 32 protein [Lachnospiraceae bacterium]